MANNKSQTMQGARNAWAKMVENPTLGNLEILRETFKKAGASWKSFREMNIPMPQTFPGRFLNSKLSDDQIKELILKDFGKNGDYHIAKLSRKSKEAA